MLSFNSDPVYSVDGNIAPTNHIFASGEEVNPWIVVDLLKKYEIKNIRFISRQDALFSDRFISVSVSVSQNVAVQSLYVLQ